MLHDSIDSSCDSFILIGFPKSEEFNDEDGPDYQDDDGAEDPAADGSDGPDGPDGPAPDSPDGAAPDGSDPEKGSSEEVQEGNAPEDEVDVGGGGEGGIPDIPTKMPSPESFQKDEENRCGNIFRILIFFLV